MNPIVQEFKEYRQRTNDLILSKNNKVISRIYSLDTLAYQPGTLTTQTKELLGLMGSMVLRCDDCIRYHLERCFYEGVTTEQIYEVFSLANLVGGTIVIPHTRRAAEFWEALISSKNETES